MCICGEPLLFIIILFIICPAGVFEKLHEAAYKNALSNSLFCPDHMVGHISVNQVWGTCFLTDDRSMLVDLLVDK